MLNLIIVIGIIASSFLTGLVVNPFIPPILDSNQTKDFICLATTIGVIYYAFTQFGFKNSNRCVTWFILYAVVSLPLHPHFRLPIWGNDLNGWWNYPVMLQVIGYYLMYLGIANADIRPDPCHARKFIGLDFRLIFKAIFYCGFFTSLYVFLQFLNVDQLFTLEPPNIVKLATAPNMTGFIGQNTLCGAFIAMAIPFGLYLRKYFFMFIMAVAVCLIQSKMAIASVLVGGLFYFVIRCKKPETLMIGVFLFIAIMLAGVYESYLHKIHINDNGRFAHWQEVLKDFSSPQIIDTIPENAPASVKEIIYTNNHHTWMLTGIGPGAYHFLYVNKYNTSWEYIHNEYIEVLYAFGIIGLFLFILAALSLILTAMTTSSSVIIAVLVTSFIVIGINAGTNFVWHINPMQFLTVLIAGLLSNQDLRRIEE